MARAEQGGGRGWRGCQPYGMRRAYDANAAWCQPFGMRRAYDANLHKENAAWGARYERRASSRRRAELREDNAVIEAYAELRRDGRGYGSYSPHRHHRLFHEKYGRRYKEDEGDPELEEEDGDSSRSMSPMSRLRKEELGELPPELISVTLDRGGHLFQGPQAPPGRSRQFPELPRLRGPLVSGRSSYRIRGRERVVRDPGASEPASQQVEDN